MHTYKITLFRFEKVKGWEEEQIFSNFVPAKVDGFGVIPNTHNSALYKKKYGTEDSKI